MKVASLLPILVSTECNYLATAAADQLATTKSRKKSLIMISSIAVKMAN